MLIAALLLLSLQDPGPTVVLDLNTGPAPDLFAPSGRILDRVGASWLVDGTLGGTWIVDTEASTAFITGGGVSGVLQGRCDFPNDRGLVVAESGYYYSPDAYAYGEQGLDLAPKLLEGLGSIGYIDSSEPVAWQGEAWFAINKPLPGSLWSARASDPFATSSIDLGVWVSPFEMRWEVVGDRLFGFTGSQLFVLDDSSSQPRFLADVDVGGGDRIFEAFDGKLWFSVDGSPGGDTLWVSDGTVAGTLEVFDTGLGFGVEPILALGADANRLWLSIDDGVVGRELWSVAAGELLPSLVADLSPGPGSGLPEPLAGGDFAAETGAVLPSGDLVFSAGPSPLQRELFVADGAGLAAPFMVDLFPGGGASSPGSFHLLSGLALFVATAPGTGRQIWRTDGSAAGTVQISSLPIGQGALVDFTVKRGEGAILVPDGQAVRLWTTDGTHAGTVPGPALRVENRTSSSFAQWFMRHGSEVFFESRENSPGTRLWATDGTARGTRLALEAAQGSPFANPAPVLSLGTKLLFTNYPVPGIGGLFATDGTPGSEVVLDSPTSGEGYIGMQDFHRLGELAVFFGIVSADQERLVRTDGTPAGTFALTDGTVDPVFDSASPFDARRSASLGKRVVFGARTAATGHELWVSDGTVAGTRELADLQPGPESSSPKEFLRVGDVIYFNCSTDEFGSELWRTDGTEAGTALAVDITPGPVGADLFALGRAGDRLVFDRGPGGSSTVWGSDGTPGGTLQLIDVGTSFVNPVPLSGRPYRYAVGDRSVFKTRTTLQSLYYGEVWSSDGTAAGTVKLDLGEYLALDHRGYFPLGGTGDVLFTGYSATTGQELYLYRMDTGEVEPLGPQDPGSYGQAFPRLVRIGDRSVFGGSTLQAGEEAFFISASALGAHSSTPFGQGCSQGVEPVLSGSGVLRPGGTILLETEFSGPGEVVLMFSSSSPAMIPFGAGCIVYLAAPVLRGVANANLEGDSSLAVGLPDNPALVGVQVTVQAAITEPGGPLLGAFALSQALDLVVGP